MQERLGTFVSVFSLGGVGKALSDFPVSPSFHLSFSTSFRTFSDYHHL